MSTPSLFDPPPAFDRGRLAAALRKLAAEGVWIGTSSWKYEGWMGQIYSRERYLTRGRFSKRYFESACLGEYAETFPIVCGDFSFYQFPSEEYWRRLFHSAPESLQYAFKVPENITVKMFPAHARYGRHAGEENGSYLDAALFRDAFLGPLEPYRRQVAALIFEFGTFSKRSYPGAGEFLADLDRFLAAIPPGWRYSVEIRNPEYLGPDYFACLRAHGVAHVFNGWTRMPEIGRQIKEPGSSTTGFSVCRALLARGRSYENAVKTFSPYAKVQEPNPEARQAMRSLIARAREQQEPAFVFVNNRLEGNAPETIQAVVEDG
ncbi:MAG TPA: DUF72 domain-containing protein [Bryobacteraceae bacterium]|nr:DUF72 domain-containing protein [Bryobacteraceae bacterium]